MSTNPGAPHDDDVWNAIVADLSTDPSLSRHILPPAAATRPAEARPQERDVAAEGHQSHEDADGEGEGEGEDEAFHDAPEHFVAPDPGPIHLASDAITRFAWAGALGGPVFLMLANVFNWGSFLSGIGVLAGVGGFVALIARHRDDRDDDFTDGAVV